MMALDARSTIPRSLFDDPRATVFWDPKMVSGTWFGRGRYVAWDAWYLFGPSARWSRTPLASGGTIIGSTGDLSRAIRPYLS